jgi:hypothetical protein
MFSCSMYIIIKDMAAPFWTGERLVRVYRTVEYTIPYAFMRLFCAIFFILFFDFFVCSEARCHHLV